MPISTEAEGQDTILVKELKAGTRAQYPTRGRQIFILLCLVLGTLLVAIDTTIISVAIPTISTEFEALDDIGWYGSAYLMTLTAFQPTMSKIYKIFSPKMGYIASVALFEVGTIICAAAPTSSAFIVGRAVAGLGAAGLLQGALGIITYIAPLEKRQLYIGAVVSVFGISACGGPILGGFICSRASWRWCFWLNVPAGAAILILVVSSFKLKNTNSSSQRLKLRTKLCSMDPLGILLLLGAICSLFLVLQQGGNAWPWKSAKTIGLLFSFVILLTLFGSVQWKLGERATVPLRHLKDRTVLMGSLFLALSNASSYVKLYYVPFYFQAVHSSSTIRSGIQFLSLALPQMVSSLVTSALVTYTGYYIPFMLLGQLIGAVGTGFLTTLNLSTPTTLWATYMVLAGLGTGMGENTPYIAIQAAMEKYLLLSASRSTCPASVEIRYLVKISISACREEDFFIGNGIATFVALLGGSLAISIGSTLLTNSLTKFVRILAPSIRPSAVLRAGALNLSSLTTSSAVLMSLRQAYARSFDDTMILALALTCLGMPVACGMRWFNIKVIAADREKERARYESKPEVPMGTKMETPALSDIPPPSAVEKDVVLS